MDRLKEVDGSCMYLAISYCVSLIIKFAAFLVAEVEVEVGVGLDVDTARPKQASREFRSNYLQRLAWVDLFQL